MKNIPNIVVLLCTIKDATELIFVINFINFIFLFLGM